MTIVDMCFSCHLLYIGIGISFDGHIHPSIDASKFGSYIIDVGGGADIHDRMMSHCSIAADVHCTLFDMAQIDSAPLQKNLWQDLGGSRSVEAENFATKNFARRMTKKNFLAATKSDAVVTQSAKDTKRAHLRSAHPGFVWTCLHERLGEPAYSPRIRRLPTSASRK